MPALYQFDRASHPSGRVENASRFRRHGVRHGALFKTEWDPNKAASQRSKAWGQFSEAPGVFSDDYAITIKDEESDPDEQRFVTLGMGIKGRVLAVVYCYSGENIRIISARPAGRSEREQYKAQQ